MHMTRKHYIQLVIGVLISALALWVVFKDITFRGLIDSLANFNYWYLIPSLAVFYFGIWLRGVRWRRLFLPQYDVPLKSTVGGMFIGFAFNSVFPARAGEFARSFLIGKRDKTGFSTAFGTVVAERLLDSMTLLACLAVALKIAPISPDSTFQIQILGRDIGMTGERFMDLRNKVVLTAIVMAIGIILVSIPAARGLILRVLHAFRFIPETIRYKIETLILKFAEGLVCFHNFRQVAELFALSLAVWSTTAAASMFLAWGFDFQETMSFSQAFALVVIICIFILPAGVPGYWGFFEAGAIFSVVIMGIHPNDSMVRGYAILLHLTQWIPIVVVGLPWAWFWHVSVDQGLEEAGEVAEDEPAG